MVGLWIKSTHGQIQSRKATLARSGHLSVLRLELARHLILVQPQECSNGFVFTPGFEILGAVSKWRFSFSS